ncbi:MAG: glycosyltransferase family 2 protein [Alistipes sp.]|nr:glycosyltransferase family 2 protein [Alistipes sp.]
MKISVVINTFNSERFLEECLRSVQQFDEIVVCDMHSTDQTIAIAQRYGCRIVYHAHTGIVEPARNYAIAQAAHEWVLVLDSDEVVPDALRNYLYRFVAQAETQGYAALKMARKNYFFGRFMHGDYPDYIIRLIRKSKCNWPATIHARPQIEGRIFTIAQRRKELALEHLANESLSSRIAKINLYADKELVRRQGAHFSIAAAFFKCGWRFLRFYLIKGGWRDGRAGFTYAMLNACYKFTTIAKVWEHDANSRSPEASQ